MTAITDTTKLDQLLDKAKDGDALFVTRYGLTSSGTGLGITASPVGNPATFIYATAVLDEQAHLSDDRPLTDEELDAVLKAGGFKPVKPGRLLTRFEELKPGQLIRVEHGLNPSWRTLKDGDTYRVTSVRPAFALAPATFYVEGQPGDKVWGNYDIYAVEEGAKEDEVTTLTAQELEDLTHAHYADGYDDGYDRGEKAGYDQGVLDGHDAAEPTQEQLDELYQQGYQRGRADYRRDVLLADEVFDFWSDDVETAVESLVKTIEQARAMRRAYWSSTGEPRTSEPREISMKAWLSALAETTGA